MLNDDGWIKPSIQNDSKTVITVISTCRLHLNFVTAVSPIIIVYRLVNFSIYSRQLS